MKKITILIVVLILVGGFVYFRVGKNVPGQAPTPPSTSSGQAAPQSTTHAVSIQNFAFSQSSISIKKGHTVIWTNKDSAPHTVTADSDSGIESPTINANGTYSFTFNSTGTFAYHCKFHPSMKGTVVVAE